MVSRTYLVLSRHHVAKYPNLILSLSKDEAALTPCCPSFDKLRMRSAMTPTECVTLDGEVMHRSRPPAHPRVGGDLLQQIQPSILLRPPPTRG